MIRYMIQVALGRGGMPSPGDVVYTANVAWGIPQVRKFAGETSRGCRRRIPVARRWLCAQRNAFQAAAFPA
jgi:hypothetical protein